MDEIGTDALAAMLSITSRQVQKLAAAGVFTKTATGKWPVAASIHAYVEHRIRAEKLRAERGAGDLRSQQLRSDDLELKIEARSKKLVDEARAAALAVVDEQAGSLRVDLQAIPARLTNDIALRRRMEDAINDAFRAAAKRASAEANGVEPSREPLAASSANDARRVGKGKPHLSAQRRTARTA